MSNAGQENEQWTVVNGRSVSSLGRVRHPQTGIPYYPRAAAGGYPKIAGGIRVHHLVALGFLPPRPSENHTVDHVNRNRSDNRASNLRWASKEEQAHNRDCSNWRNGARSRPVEHWDGIQWVWYPSASEMHRATGISTGSICYCLNQGGRSHIVRHPESAVEDFQDEEWREVDGHYVSNHGRVRDGRWGKYAYFPRPQVNNHGYCVKSNLYVHVLVARAFLGERPSPEHTVDHIDRNKANNHVSNLRWATEAIQKLNQKKRKRVESDVVRRPLTSTDLKTGEIRWFESTAEAGKALGRDPSAIAKAAKGARGTHCAVGYRWEYVCSN